MNILFRKDKLTTRSRPELILCPRTNIIYIMQHLDNKNAAVQYDDNNMLINLSKAQRDRLSLPVQLESEDRFNFSHCSTQ